MFEHMLDKLLAVTKQKKIGRKRFDELVALVKGVHCHIRVCWLVLTMPDLGQSSS